MLALYQELFILFLHEEKVVVLPNASSGFPYWFVGSILSDLALMGKIQVNDNRRLVLLNEEATGDPILDEMLQKIQALEGAKKVGYWMDDFDNKPKKVNQQLFNRLVDVGVLKHEDEDHYWLIPDSTDPCQSASPKFLLKHNLRSAALTQIDTDLHNITLLSLLQACGLLDIVFFKDELKKVRRRIDEIIMSEAMKDPVTRSIQEIGSALRARIDDE